MLASLGLASMNEQRRPGFQGALNCICNPISHGFVAHSELQKRKLAVGTILIIIVILLLIGAVPRWGYSRGWGYGPSGILGVILIIVVILLLMGRL